MVNMDDKVRELRKMAVGELRQEYGEVFGEPTRSFHKDFLVRRIAWRVQANVMGGLTERAKRRALELADESDLRTRSPVALGPIAAGKVVTRRRKAVDRRLPMPGTLLTRTYKGRAIRVQVTDVGFEFEGEVYRSLSAVAKAVTGAHWNGYLFFNIPKAGTARVASKTAIREAR